jgi:diguanylate cyclase (GGDEF)-like protein/PAS domain S-box-containing protein
MTDQFHPKKPSGGGTLQGEKAMTDAGEKHWLKSIFDHMDEAVFLAPISPEGVHGNFVEVNEAVCRRYGYSREELLTFNARTINPSANLDRVRTFGRRILREGRTLFTAIHVAKDGSQIPVEVVAKHIEIDGCSYVMSVVRDLREQQLLQKAEARFGHLMDHSWHEIYIFDSTTLRFIQVNQGALDNLGYNNQEILQLRLTDLAPRLKDEEFAALAKPLFDGSQSLLVFETALKRKAGSTYPVEVRLQLSHSEVPPIFLANVQNITERKKTESRLQFLANFDALTELPNRTLFLDRLKVAVENAKRNNRLTAVIFLDLDGFKAINDTLGHGAGDQVIKEVGKRLTRCVRKSDTVARLGGDEFTVLLTNVNNTSNVECAAQKIIRAVAAPMEIAGQIVNITTSLGITLCPLDDNDTAETLIKQADSAMYQAKSLGKNTFEFYRASLAAGELRQLELMNALKQALSRNEFELYYQPRVNLDTQQVIGAEALLRWKHPKLGFVSPAEFIPLLEANGHIKEVGAWVLSEACRQLRRWYEQGHELRLSINVSARQFEKGIFSDQLQQHIQQLAIPATLLEIEITEGYLISQTEQAAETLNRLKKIGVNISLDDFGTGYSSLTYLKQLPIDILKIDRSFVMDMLQNHDSAAIVDAIIGLARTLELKVTAEGIEESAQADFLKQRFCHEGQGYYFGRPMPAAEFARVCLKAGSPSGEQQCAPEGAPTQLSIQHSVS